MKKQSKRRTVMDLVLDKCPEFDPKTCSVIVNNQKVDACELRRPLVAFDIVRIVKPEEKE